MGLGSEDLPTLNLYYVGDQLVMSLGSEDLSTLNLYFVGGQLVMDFRVGRFADNSIL